MQSTARHMEKSKWKTWKCFISKIGFSGKLCKLSVATTWICNYFAISTWMLTFEACNTNVDKLDIKYNLDIPWKEIDWGADGERSSLRRSLSTMKNRWLNSAERYLCDRRSTTCSFKLENWIYLYCEWNSIFVWYA